MGAPSSAPRGARRTFVKICGITNREDAHAAVDAGADGLGFVAIQESPRFVSAVAFHRILDILPPGFPVFVLVRRLSDAAKYSAPIVQVYETGTLDGEEFTERKRVQVVRVSDSSEIAAAETPHPSADAVLLDAMHTALLGGSGARFDWMLASGLRSRLAKPFFLAGGLTPGNVEQALDAVNPHGVDVSSGVEDTTPGAKDHKQVERFITNVRRWDQSDAWRELGPAPSLFEVFRSEGTKPA